MTLSTDDEGRTALHWAAEQLGRCLGLGCNRGDHTDPDGTGRVQEYRDLVSGLIRLGADANAIDWSHRSPFFACFDAMINNLLYWGTPGTSTLEAAARVWGRAITNGGLPLLRYTSNENRKLALLRPSQRTFSSDSSHIYYVLERLETYQNADLIVHATLYDTIYVWQFKPPPGAWDQPRHNRTICLHLHAHIEREDFHLREIMACHKIRTGSFPVTRDNHSRWYQSLGEAWEDFMLSSQDDHGPIAMTASRALALDDPTRFRPKRRRANSYTRSVTPWVVASANEAPPNVLHFRGERLLNLHKCSLTSKWSYFHGWWHGQIPKEADCLLGQCMGTENRASIHMCYEEWKIGFTQHHCDLERVRRFVDRFCPEGK